MVIRKAGLRSTSSLILRPKSSVISTVSCSGSWLNGWPANTVKESLPSWGGGVNNQNWVRAKRGFYLVKLVTGSSAAKFCTGWWDKARSCSAGVCPKVPLTWGPKPETHTHRVLLKWQWRSPVFKWRAGCAERCTSGLERRGREIVRLRPVAYSTKDTGRLALSGYRDGFIFSAYCGLAHVIQNRYRLDKQSVNDGL